MSFDVILYFFADDGYEIRVRLEGYPSYRSAAKFLVDSYGLRLNGDELSLVGGHGPWSISGSTNSSIKAFLYRQRTEARRLLDAGRKNLFEDCDYELVDLPLCKWRGHPALARGKWSVGGVRIINSITQQEQTNGTSET